MEGKEKERSSRASALPTRNARPRRFALNYHPPTLVVEFAADVDGARKVFLQRIFMKALTPTAVRGNRCPSCVFLLKLVLHTTCWGRAHG